MTETREPLSLDDISCHNSEKDCWIAVSSKVWNITDFLDLHPGGKAVILKYAGADATAAYEEIHAPGMLEETLSADKLIGDLAPNSAPSSHVAPPSTVEEASKTQETPPAKPQTQVTVTVQEPAELPPLCSLIAAYDFEEVAKRHFTPKAWAFYSSAATDLVTHHANKSVLRRVMIRPRVLRDVKDVSIKTKILGHDCAAPFFISPAAMARLAHKDGELALARGASAEGIVQCISSNASYPLGSIVNAGADGQVFFLQLYVNWDRPKTAELLKKAASLGIKAVFVTVDAPVPGKREADERVAAEAVASAISGAVASNDKKGGGMGRLMAAYVEKSLIWKDIQWIKEVSGLPVVLKGVQSAADTMLAVKYGAAGVMLSNHGGRSLDGAQPTILVLLELHRVCPEIFDQLEIYVDGGFERGSDILKALALGVTAVGLGRPYLYSLAYGTEGVEHLTQILKDELETSMRLCGITNTNQAHPGLLNTQDVDHMVTSELDHPWIKILRCLSRDIHKLLLPPSFWAKAVSEEVLLGFYRDVADASPIPIVCYNFPGVTSGVDLSSDDLSALASHPNIVATKLTCGNVGKAIRLTAKFTPKQFSVFGGSSDFLYPTLAAGGIGCVTGMGNVWPKSTARVYDLYVAGELEEARRLQDVVASAEWACKKSLALTKFGAGHFAGKKLGLSDPKTRYPRKPYLPVNEKLQAWTVETMGVLEAEEAKIPDRVFKQGVNGVNGIK